MYKEDIIHIVEEYFNLLKFKLNNYMGFEQFGKKAAIAAGIGAALAGAPQKGKSAEVVGQEGYKIEMAQAGVETRVDAKTNTTAFYGGQEKVEKSFEDNCKLLAQKLSEHVKQHRSGIKLQNPGNGGLPAIKQSIRMYNSEDFANQGVDKEALIEMSGDQLREFLINLVESINADTSNEKLIQSIKLAVEYLDLGKIHYSHTDINVQKLMEDTMNKIKMDIIKGNQGHPGEHSSNPNTK
jgi:hypothetical protein